MLLCLSKDLARSWCLDRKVGPIEAAFKAAYAEAHRHEVAASIFRGVRVSVYPAPKFWTWHNGRRWYYDLPKGWSFCQVCRFCGTSNQPLHMIVSRWWEGTATEIAARLESAADTAAGAEPAIKAERKEIERLAYKSWRLFDVHQIVEGLNEELQRERVEALLPELLEGEQNVARLRESRRRVQEDRDWDPTDDVVGWGHMFPD